MGNVTANVQEGNHRRDDRRDSRTCQRESLPDEFWWLAINGASCAASEMPIPTTVKVIPTPEQLLGFRTQDEQLAAQRSVSTCLRHLRDGISVFWTRFASGFPWMWGPAPTPPGFF